MPLTVDDIWTVTPASGWTGIVRDDLDTRLGLDLDYVGTADGAWTAQAGALAYEAEQRMAAALSGALLVSAPRPVVVARALDRGLTPRAATRSTMTITMATGTGGVLPVGTELRVREGEVLFIDPELGGITVTTDALWEVTENVHTGGFIEVADEVVIECTQAGRVFIEDPITLAPVTPISGIGTLTGEDTDTVGREAESLPGLRRRVASARSQVGGAPPGLLATVRDLPWVVAAGLEETPGHFRVTVAPAPPTGDDAEDLGRAVYDAHPVGSTPLGAQTVTVEGADGRDFTIRYDVGATVNVTVVFTVTPVSTVSMATARALVQSAIEEEFARLGPGDPIRYLRVIAALSQPGVIGGTVTLDGDTDDVTPPTAADLLTPVFP